MLLNDVPYLPHHPVKKDSVTTPIRIVCDCSCWGSGMLASLNDCLTVGPPFLNNYCTVLLCLGIHVFALSTDIEKALLYVKLHPLDKNFTRFLWPSNLEDPDSDIVLLWFHLELIAHPLCLEQCWTYTSPLQVASDMRDNSILLPVSRSDEPS